MSQKILLLAVAGAVGTLARYGLSGMAQRVSDVEFPFGTLAVNVTGCFLAGLFWAMAENRMTISGEMRTVILIGFFGAFTTFSTFALETGGFVRDSQWIWVLGNILANNVAGITFLLLGQAAGRLV